LDAYGHLYLFLFFQLFNRHRASFFGNEELPKWNPSDEIEYKFSGKRIKRGLYRTSTGIELNAEINGALNILRKSNLVDCKILQARGYLACPLRISLL
jgi:putative transposase